MKRLISLIAISLFGQEVSVLTYFPLSDFPVTFEQLDERGVYLKTYLHDFKGCLRGAFSPEVEKIFVMGDCEKASNISKLPLEKRVLFVWEPKKIDRSYYKLFKRVYTYNDDLVDGKKYHKIYYPCLLPMREERRKFDEKKLLTMVASNWTQERKEVLYFFDGKPQGEFEYYGSRPGPTLKNYRGIIRGTWRSEEKLATLGQYRFCIAFENHQNIRGYITEKIFCCFAAGIIPIYWGAPNITEYIPKECFIDWRDFASIEELYSFLKSMTEERYNEYIYDIQKYLQSEEAKLFSSKHFNEILYEAMGIGF